MDVGVYDVCISDNSVWVVDVSDSVELLDCSLFEFESVDSLLLNMSDVLDLDDVDWDDPDTDDTVVDVPDVDVDVDDPDADADNMALASFNTVSGSE